MNATVRHANRPLPNQGSNDHERAITISGRFTESARRARFSPPWCVPGTRQSRPRLEFLEERLAPATFAVSSGTLDLVLGTSEKVAIVSSTTSYTLSLGTGQTWTDTDSADVAGNGLQSLTVTSTGINDFSTGIDITDSGSTGGDAVAFNDSTTNPYANNLIIVVDVHTPKANVQYTTLDRKPLKSVRNRHQTNTILNTSHEPKSTTVLELKYRSYEMFTIIQEFTEKYRGFRGSLFSIHPLSGCERLLQNPAHRHLYRS
ncbi:MAG: hypothetical protein ACXWO1_07180 [Isosphaeraceae bacterium]